jgi:hypothetical protein
MALALEGAIEGAHMGHPDFRANGRIFASLQDGERRGMVVLTPEHQADVVARGAPAFEPESGAWGRQGCTRICLASAGEELVGEALTLAWQISAEKAASQRSRRSSTRCAVPRQATKPRG